MANRHLSRSIVLQTLFEWDVQGGRGTDIDVANALERNIEEFAPDSGDFSFMKDLLDGAMAKQKELDEIIVKAAPEWPIEKISTIDRNILRLGLFELLFGDRKEVPAKVAINEAIELAKSFGGESSGRFVNGVLGAVYKDIGEPGKAEKTEKKEKGKDPEKESLCGAVVFAQTNEGIKLALVHDVFGRWTLCKGHKKDKEENKKSALNAAQCELGVEGEVVEELGSNEYTASHPERGKVKKEVTYYLVEAPYGDLTLDTSGGLDDARWFSIEEIAKLNIYDDIRAIIDRAIETIGKKR